MRQTFTRAWIYAGFLILIASNIAFSCPNCKEAVALQPEDSSRMADGYNWSVLFMLVVPFTMLGTGGLVVRQAARKGYLPEM